MSAKTGQRNMRVVVEGQEKIRGVLAGQGMMGAAEGMTVVSVAWITGGAAAGQGMTRAALAIQGITGKVEAGQGTTKGAVVGQGITSGAVAGQ